MTTAGVRVHVALLSVPGQMHSLTQEQGEGTPAHMHPNTKSTS